MTTTSTTPAAPTPSHAEMLADELLFINAGIAPEDQHYADAILAMDPMSIRNSNHHFSPDMKLSPARVSALPPGPERSAVEARLQSLSPEDREAQEPAMITEALRRMLPEIRAMTGLGPDAPEFYREGALISGEHRDLSRRLATIEAELEEVGRYQVNPETGEPVPVLRYEGNARSARIAERDEIARKMRVLINPETGKAGVEGRRRLGEALRESVALVKALDEQAKEAVEVKRLAEQIDRDERVMAKAKALASVRRNSL